METCCNNPDNHVMILMTLGDHLVTTLMELGRSFMMTGYYLVMTHHENTNYNYDYSDVS